MRLPEYQENILRQTQTTLHDTPETPKKLVELPHKSYNQQMIELNRKYSNDTYALNTAKNIFNFTVDMANIGLKVADFFAKGEANRQKALGANMANEAIREYNKQSMIESANTNTIDQSNEVLNKIAQKYYAQAGKEFGEDSVAYNTFRNIFDNYSTQRLDWTMLKKQKRYLEGLQNQFQNLAARGIVENNSRLIEDAGQMLLDSGYYTDEEVMAMVASANSNRIKQSVSDKLANIPMSTLENFLFKNKGLEDLYNYGITQEEAQWMSELTEDDKEKLFQDRKYIDDVRTARILNWQKGNYNYLANHIFDNENPTTLERARKFLTEGKITLDQYKKIEVYLKDKNTSVKMAGTESKIRMEAAPLIARYRKGLMSPVEFRVGVESLIDKYTGAGHSIKDPTSLKDSIISAGEKGDIYSDALDQFVEGFLEPYKPSPKDAIKLAKYKEMETEFRAKAMKLVYDARRAGKEINLSDLNKGFQNIAESIFAPESFKGDDPFERTRLNWDNIWKTKDEHGFLGIFPKSDVANVTREEALMSFLISGEGIGMSADSVDPEVTEVYKSLTDKFVALAQSNGLMSETTKAIQYLDPDNLIPMFALEDGGKVKGIYTLDVEDTDKGGKILKLVSREDFYKKHSNLKFGRNYGEVIGEKTSGSDTRVVYLPEVERETGVGAGDNYVYMSDFKHIGLVNDTMVFSYLGNKNDIKDLTQKQFFANKENILKRFYFYDARKQRYIGNISNFFDVNNKDALNDLWKLIRKYKIKEGWLNE